MSTELTVGIISAALGIAILMWLWLGDSEEKHRAPRVDASAREIRRAEKRRKGLK